MPEMTNTIAAGSIRACERTWVVCGPVMSGTTKMRAAYATTAKSSAVVRFR
jgi:hypothetical protein